ncbi:bile acid:sodium symporter family protein [Paenibacillus taiwanensis]|uniref:bile acid:sodium symporter family protein n=1 Tax=Paenibacillus taiwanensis TaxID=401638 RepID=UPI000684197E|nr:hypothetical protein [Paenibacillus taiwanensis]
MNRIIGLQINSWFERYMFMLIPLSLVLGVLCDQILLPYVAGVPWLFGFVTFVMGLGCGIKDMTQAWQRPAVFLTVLVSSHLIAPAIAYSIGAILFGPTSPISIGMVLFTLIPLGVSSVLWVDIARGAVGLMLALVVIDSLLSPVLVPSMLLLLYGESVAIDTWGMLKDLLLILVLPIVVGVIIHSKTNGRAKPVLAPVLLPLSKLAFVGVVSLNAAAIGPYVRQLNVDSLIVILVIVLLVAGCYVIGFMSGNLFKKDRLVMCTTLGFATGMRNVSLGLVLAMQYFGPDTAVVVVLSILIQQPAATLFYTILQKLHMIHTSQTEPTSVP